MFNYALRVTFEAGFFVPKIQGILMCLGMCVDMFGYDWGYARARLT